MPGPTELIIILVILLVVLGTKKLKNMGTDLGSAIKGFKNAVSDEDKPAATETTELDPEATDKEKP